MPHRIQMAPPKDRRSIISARSTLGIWVTVWMAISQLRCPAVGQFYVVFFAMILQFGYLRLAATVQFINLVRHFPNLHCWSRSVSVREFTLVPDVVHLKPLWSCVSLSFSTISPRSLIVYWAWMFRGAMQTPGMHVILLSERGRAYPWMRSLVTSSFNSSGCDDAPL